MKRGTWAVFVLTQIAATAVISGHFLPDRIAIWFYLVLFPGLPVVYTVIDNRWQGSLSDVVGIGASVLVNALFWFTVAMLWKRHRTAHGAR